MIYRTLSLTEILEILEKHDSNEHVSETDEYPEHRIVNVFITPPANDNETDEDSGDEEDVCLSSLSEKQLRSNATKSRERLEHCEFTDNRSRSARRMKIKLSDRHNVEMRLKPLLLKPTCRKLLMSHASLMKH